MTLSLINKKSTLAKLLATENIEVQQNNVRTASFDVKNRILTIPIFKHENKDVLDMLIAHECAHALWTGLDDWKSIVEESEEFKAYCNVLEDCRIDRMIQKKYPGIVKNYVKGYRELIKIDFFGVNNKDFNTLNLIDRINLFYKSSKSADISFYDAEWVIDEIDNLKSLDDVKVLARKLIEQEKAKQESTSDNHEQGDSNEESTSDVSDDSQSSSQYDDNDTVDDVTDEDTKEEETTTEQKSSDEEGEVPGEGGQDSESSTINKEPDPITEEQDKIMPQTVKNAESNTDKVTYSGDKFLKYFNVPDTDIKKAVITNSQFRKDHKDNFLKQLGANRYNADSYRVFYDWLKKDFAKFKHDNLKTVNYLVKEFEMKKSATAYKRASTDKTGVIDPLKLKNYKFSDDIFKRLTILPDGKNHGFIFLLDWSGSMYDCMDTTIEQLMNLVYFAKKINIPFKVYAFTEWGNNYTGANTDIKHPFNYKNGDLEMRSNVRLIDIASHTLKKRDLDESMFFLHYHKVYYQSQTRGRYNDRSYSGAMFWMPEAYNLSSTPLNEALVVLDKIIPLFKNKYSIEKLSLVTLTDGHANSMSRHVIGQSLSSENFARARGKVLVPVIKNGNKRIMIKKKNSRNRYGYAHSYDSRDYTNLLITLLKQKYSMIAVGFHIMKNVNYGISDYCTEKNYDSFRKKMVKGSAVAEIKHGYDEFYVLNNKKLKVIVDNNTDEITEDMKTSQIKRLFSKGMKGKITSRVVLNKFIEKVA